MLHTPETVSASSPRPLKRPRISQACGSCRDRKTRCDGDRPVCRACLSRGVGSTCSYERSNKKPRAPIDHSYEPIRATEAPTYGSFGRPLETSQGISKVPIEGSEPQSLLVAQCDAVGILADGQDESLFGPSSIVTFLRNVTSDNGRHDLTGFSGSDDGRAYASNGDTSLPKINVGIAMESGNVAFLPRRRDADDLLLSYWDHLHPVFPVLHRTNFIRRYELLWLPEVDLPNARGPKSEGEDAVFLATLNLVFAIGCKLSDSTGPAQKSSTAEDFYQRSHRLQIQDTLNQASIPVVQMLLLTSMYLQSTKQATRCWNILGIAIRTAQTLGLHLNLGGPKPISQVESEMKLRIWHTCVTLDRLSAMAFGRPAMIQKTCKVPLPAEVDDKYLSTQGERLQPLEITSSLGLFVWTCRLLEVLADIVDLLYSSNEASRVLPKADVVTQIMNLNRRLDDFYDALPAYLRNPNQKMQVETNEHSVRLQQEILYCRFLVIKILVLRPLMLCKMTQAEYVSEQLPSCTGTKEQISLDDAVIHDGCRLCVDTAYRLINTVYDGLRSRHHNTGWHTVHFTFSSGVIFIAALKTSLVSSDPVDETFEACWNRCLNVLDHYKEQVPSAAHAAKVLLAIRRQISQRPRDGRLSPNERNIALQRHESSHASPPLDQVQMSLDSSTALLPDSVIESALDMNDPLFFGMDGIPDEWFGPYLNEVLC